MARFLATLFFAFELLISPVANAEIYRWVDEQGNVNFGDRPPADSASQSVQDAPEHSQEAVTAAQERARRLQDYERQARKGREDRAAVTDPVGIGKPPLESPADIPCFAPLADTWGQLIPDTREGPQRRRLSDAEYRSLQGLLKSLEGRRDGVIRETVCIRPDAEPSSKSDNIDVDWQGRWQSERIFRIRADPQGEGTEFFSILWSREGLRFRWAQTDLSFQLDRPGNDAEIVELTSNSLSFFWRRGGRIPRTNVISISRVGRGISMREFAYVRGQLSGKRFWEIDR
jgi:hypothetical protein